MEQTKMTNSCLMNEMAELYSGNSSVHSIQAVTGYIVQIDQEQNIYVNFPGNDSDCMKARILSSITFAELLECIAGRVPVLLMFEPGYPQSPIIVGIVRDRAVNTPGSQEPTPLSVPPEESVKKQKCIEADDEVVLRCGKGSISIQSDGRILIKGTYILSRSSGPNKIKGGTVQIN